MRLRGKEIAVGIFTVLTISCASLNKHSSAGHVATVERDSGVAAGELSSKHGIPRLTEQSTLSDYLEYAALNNPALEAAFYRWKAAVERAAQVRSLPDPKFTYTYFIREIETRTGPQRQRFGLAQMFPWFGTLELRGDVAVEAANAERQRYESAKLRLFYQVKELYYEYYYLARAVAVTEEMVQLLTNLETVAEARYKAGQAPYAELIKAQVERDRLEDRLQTLRDMRRPVISKLNAAMGLRQDTDLPWPTEIPEEPVSFTDDQIFTWLAENNPELKAGDAAAAKEYAETDLARKSYYPDFTLGVTYMETGSSRMPDTRDSGEDPVAVTLSVNVPLWRDKYAAAVREARARHDVAKNERVNLENVLVAEVQTVLYKFRDAERKIDLYRDSLVPKALRSLNATEQAYRAGQSAFFDVIEAEQTLLEFRLAYERALTDRDQRLAELEMLIGTGIPGIS